MAWGSACTRSTGSRPVDVLPDRAGVVLGLSDHSPTVGTVDVQLRTEAVDGHPAAPHLEERGIHGRGVMGLTRVDERVEPPIAHHRVVLDEGEPFGARAVGAHVAGLVRGEEAAAAGDTDPSCRLDAVERRRHRTWRIAVDDHHGVLRGGAQQ